MTSSEIITIIAISATVLTSIISALALMVATRSTIQARRSEIALSERLRAFGEVYNLISDVNSRLNLFQSTFKNQDVREYLNYKKILANENEIVGRRVRAEIVRRLVEIDHGFIESYNKRRVYIPPHIDKEIQKYYRDVLEPVSTETIEEIISSVPQMKSLQDNYSEQILAMIHKFIGFS